MLGWWFGIRRYLTSMVTSKQRLPVLQQAYDLWFLIYCDTSGIEDIIGISHMQILFDLRRCWVTEVNLVFSALNILESICKNASLEKRWEKEE